MAQFDNFESKSALRSKTVIGGIIAIAPLAVELASEIVAIPGIPSVLIPIVSAIGGIIAIIGRFAAKFPIRLF